MLINLAQTFLLVVFIVVEFRYIVFVDITTFCSHLPYKETHGGHDNCMKNILIIFQNFLLTKQRKQHCSYLCIAQVLSNQLNIH